MKKRAHRMDKAGYSQVFKKGKLIKRPGLNVRVFQFQEESESKVGYIIRKRCGNAVNRFFLRRQFRSCFMEQLPFFKMPMAIVFEAQKDINTLSRKALRNTVFSILRAL